MSEISETQESTLPLSAAQWINEVCNRFEQAWQAGQRPRIEDYLVDAPESRRTALLRELLALEIDCRRQAGEEPTTGEYQARFPSLSLAPLGAGQTAREHGPHPGE